MIAQPLFETWCVFKPNFQENLIFEGIDANRRLLVQKVDETKFMGDDKQQQIANNATPAGETKGGLDGVDPSKTAPEFAQDQRD